MPRRGEDDSVRLSKKMSYLLRHSGLDMNSDGYVVGMP